MSSRNTGIYWCLACLAMRASELADDSSDVGDPTPDLACATCGYVWGPVYIEQPDGPTIIEPTLSVADRKRGIARVADAFEKYILHEGLEIRNMTDPTVRIPRRNQGG